MTKARKKGTDPDCPSVGAVAPDDIPFIFEGSEEFPARRGGRPQLNSQIMSWKQGYCRETHINIPSAVCQRFTVAAVEKNKR